MGHRDGTGTGRDGETEKKRQRTEDRGQKTDFGLIKGIEHRVDCRF
jgi:hypothetical protein